ncbi:MAG: hypothetical protein FWE67_15040, partial [Planctomycetaceae bacterium]|nr:hypothetical protein [Planctomycetaceae bacterium]
MHNHCVSALFPTIESPNLMGKSFFPRYGFSILLIVMFLLSFIWMGAKRTLMSNANNVADWLPENFTETKEYNWFQKHFPYESFVVVSWRGCTMDDDRLEMFAQKLVPGQTIDNMLDWMDSTSHLQAELRLPVDTIRSTQSNEELVPAIAETQTKETVSPPETAVPEPQYFKSVLTGQRLFRLFSERYGEDSAAPLSHEEIIQRLDGVLIGPQRTAADGSPLPFKKYPTAMIVTLNKPKHEKELRLVLNKIRAIGRECGVEPEKPVDNRPFFVWAFESLARTVQDMVFGIPYEINGIVMGGPPVDNVAISIEGERTLYRLAGLCAVIGLGIAMICFRSLRLSMFIFWTAILSAGLALAMVWFTGSRCDAIMLSMPALIYVLGMSGAIHLINYYKD